MYSDKKIKSEEDLMKKIVVCFMILMLFGLGCEKFKGIKGDTGDMGQPGVSVKGDKGDTGNNAGTMYRYEGVIPASGDYYATLPIDITTDDIVQVSYALAVAPNIYTELGEPTGSYSGSLYRWAMISFTANNVYFENMSAGDKWLIVVIKKI
jgi:hypothetical protein